MMIATAHPWRRVALLILLASVASLSLVAGCGEDPEPDPAAAAATAPMPTGSPIALKQDNAAVRLGFGDMPLMTGHSSLQFISDAFSTAVLEVQVIDERKAQEFNPTDVKDNPAVVQAKKRTEELLDEIDEAIAADGVADFDRYVLVIDLFRVNSRWLVRWDGVKIRDIDEDGAYGLDREDMRTEEKKIILDAIAEAADRKPLTHVVIGAAIERLELVNPEDFGNFVSFYGEVYDAIKERWPDLLVSPGLNWDRFETEIAALYTPGGTVGEVTFAHIRAAWMEIGEALFDKADFLGLQAEPEPSTYAGDPAMLPDSQYALLAEIQGDRPVVWYSVNWPVTSGAEKVTQRDYLRRFLELNAGNDIDLISWRGVRDFGPDDCPRTTALGGPRSDCAAGIFSDSLAKNKLSDEFESTLLP